jgi:uncharacterized membrane-anchored protein YitT (DUF2179 family)
VKGLKPDPKNDIRRAVVVAIASVLMAINIKTFVRIGGLYPGGATGLTILIQRIGMQYFGMELPYSIINILLNAFPVYIGFRYIGKKFTLFSVEMILLTGYLTDLIPAEPLTYDTLLISIFGGLINGAVMAMCLRVNATTGGTDSISIYMSQKTGMDSFNMILGFNAVILLAAGYFFGWDKALYSIIFQYISTHMITTFHNRYKLEMMQIFTKKPDDVVSEYLKHFQHGITVLNGTGGYTGEDTSMLMSVTSSYELQEAIEVITAADPDAIINVTKTSQFIGKFAQPKI